MTVLSVALSGITVAVSVMESPSIRVISVLSRVTEETSIVFILTVTMQVADCPPAVAVVVAVPWRMPVTLPSLTDAM